MTKHRATIICLFFLLPAIIAGAAVWLIFAYSPTSASVIDAFLDGIRNSLFTGFLTVGGFLLSMKTYIVIKLKEQVYDDPRYLLRLSEHRKINSDLSHYGPLKRLNELMYYAVVASLSASASQLTIGLFHRVETVAICLFLGAYALALLFVALFIIKKNMNDWFEFLEEPTEPK